MGALLRAVALLVATLPWRALPVLGAALGWLAGSVLRVRRAHVVSAMRAAGVPRPAEQARAFYAELGTSALELLHLSVRGPRDLAHAHVEPSSLAAWRGALARGRGVVLAASHTGNWDLAAARVARDVELLVVTKRLSAGALDAFWQSTRAGLGVYLAGADGALAKARAVLRRGGAVALMIDQAPARARGAQEEEFLGQRAWVDRAPAALAMAAGAPLVVAAARRDERGQQALAVLDVIEPPPKPSAAWIGQATAAATARLDAFVRAHPTQWLWLHRRWKRLDPGDTAARMARPCRTTKPLPLPPTRRTTRSSSPAAGSPAA